MNLGKRFDEVLMEFTTSSANVCLEQQHRGAATHQDMY